jgi:hypothetical protein
VCNFYVTFSTNYLNSKKQTLKVPFLDYSIRIHTQHILGINLQLVVDYYFVVYAKSSQYPGLKNNFV